eukprot:9065746-Lingulodinium_polyedra.AAC.1
MIVVHWRRFSDASRSTGPPVRSRSCETNPMSTAARPPSENAPEITSPKRSPSAPDATPSRFVTGPA